MKKTLRYISIILLTASFSSCEKFLDEQPLHALTDANAITSASKARSAINGIYATFQNDAWSGGLYAALAAKSGFANFVESDYDMGYSQTSGGNPGIWQAFYKSLNAANFAITGINNLSEAAITADEKNTLLAEAKCLRAWINANLLWNFGHWWGEDADPDGLLYRDQVMDLGNVIKGRISVGESYAKIYEDLDAAIAGLKDISTPRYVSRQFAKALKAKLLLYRGGYRNDQEMLSASLTLVNDVLQNHPATLALEANMNDIYKNAWDSRENLFARYLEDNGTRTTAGGYYYTYRLIYLGNKLPLPVGATLTAGLRYGVDWFKADPRWDVATGPVRSPETWDNTMNHTFKKVCRLGSYAGRIASPIDEKYTAYYFRFAELYLMKAELLARTGASAADAIAPINEMRAKRTTPALPALSPANMQDAMNMIFREIFLELFLENGSEFFAAVRFSNNGQPWIVTIKDGKALVENRICWPIPDTEIINNPAMTQNADLK
jgi:hypothetical protein